MKTITMVIFEDGDRVKFKGGGPAKDTLPVGTLGTVIKCDYDDDDYNIDINFSESPDIKFDASEFDIRPEATGFRWWVDRCDLEIAESYSGNCFKTLQKFLS